MSVLLPSAPGAARRERFAAILAVVVGVGLMAVKFIAYGLTGSAAIFSDAVESIVNVLASLLALYAVWLAHEPPDESHPYGHGKVEFISAAFEGGAICIAAVVIVVRTVEALVRGGIAVEHLGIGLVLIGASIAVNGGVGAYLIWLGRRTGSMTLEADGRHLASDSITSASAIAALLIVRFTGWQLADPIAALLMAAYIGWTGLFVFRRAMGGLMDEQDAADRRLVHSILEAHRGPGGKEPRICSYHKVRHRHSGRYHWIDLHLLVPAGMPVREAHDTASAIEHEIEQALGPGDATAHIEPCEDAACPTCHPA